MNLAEPFAQAGLCPMLRLFVFMTLLDLLHKKRDGLALSEAEIEFIIKSYLEERVPDYQMSALLMAIYFQGMNDSETVALTRLMRDSGVVMDFSHVPGPKVDKHSTGGVGDKVSLILAPLMAAAGVYVPMISGRGLGHTGGTLDKLEAIPGFRTQLPLHKFRELTEKIGTCLIGQTEEICPADRRIYALRDVTATVSAIPLICASILSKKLAEGLDALVLDVKVGEGAIFKDAATAEKLARRLIATATHFRLRTMAVLTDMSQPLGNAIGNWVEVVEAIEVLRGGGPEDTKQVTLALGAAMLQAVGKSDDIKSSMRTLNKLLQNGAAWEKFLEVVTAQGGEVGVLHEPARYAQPTSIIPIKAAQAGYVAAINARELGRLSMALGAGRANLKQGVDPLAGIMLHKKVGEAVVTGEILATLQSSTIHIDEAHLHSARSSFSISEQSPKIPPLLLAKLDEHGRHELAL